MQVQFYHTIASGNGLFSLFVYYRVKLKINRPSLTFETLAIFHLKKPVKFIYVILFSFPLHVNMKHLFLHVGTRIFKKLKGGGRLRICRRRLTNYIFVSETRICSFVLYLRVIFDLICRLCRELPNWNRL